jgi:hypothetical protein
MLKLMSSFKRKPGTSWENFSNCVETNHVPLVLECFPTLTDYRCSYTLPNGAVHVQHIDAKPPEPEFDALTELRFEDRLELTEFLDLCNEPLRATRISTSEETCFNRSTMTHVIAKEYATPSETLPLFARGNPASSNNDGKVTLKMICLLKRKPGMSRDAFIEYYETMHAPLALQILPPVFARYTRSFILTNDTDETGYNEPSSHLLQYDVVTEICFENRSQFDDFVAGCADPAVGARLAADEENLFDRSEIKMFLSEEHRHPPGVRLLVVLSESYRHGPGAVKSG